MSAAKHRYERAWKRAKQLGVTEQLAELAERAVETLQQCEAAYDDLRWGDEPDAILVLEAPAVLPGDALPELGVLEYVEYSGSKGGKDHIWCHPFRRERPRLCVTTEGKLVIVGGSYTVTDRGIVG